MKKKKKKMETVRLIIFDQTVIDVVSGTVSRKEILENFIVTKQRNDDGSWGKFSAKTGEALVADSHIFKINRESLLWKHCVG